VRRTWFLRSNFSNARDVSYLENIWDETSMVGGIVCAAYFCNYIALRNISLDSQGISHYCVNFILYVKNFKYSHISPEAWKQVIDG